MPLTHQDNGASMGETLKEVSTLKKLLHFGGPKRQTKAHNLNNFLGKIGVGFEVGLEVG
jgi:hypothetical protein